MDIIEHNRFAWDTYVEKRNRWTIPVSEKEIEKAKRGIWNIVLTPTKPVPHVWFPSLKGIEVLGLASGGGQQCPILAAVGARVTVFDNSENQLKQDIELSKQFGLNIKAVRGNMKDLSVFPSCTFDLIFNPCSVAFVDDVKIVWRECYRVLKPNGILMTGLINPILYQLEQKEKPYKLIYKQPYSDISSLPKEQLEKLVKSNEPLEFGHSLTDQIGGQLKAGFILTHMYEDIWSKENGVDSFFPPFIATRAIKTL